ncbi:methyltransferase [Streptomyces sp. NPDC050704]|uniref:protein-L-isoaspartate O-methyltransferase family protein n=1 Tax=Streptomyces sp. NPDC050704 TaxID=3157219 RepID=UPI003443DD65
MMPPATKLITGSSSSAPDARSGFAAALASVRRRDFVPAVIRTHRGGRWRKVDQERAPRDWSKLVHGPDPVVFDVNDGEEGGAEITGVIPSAADTERCLTVLAPEPGMRIAEIGTDSGWVAALLQHLVQDGRVVSAADTLRLAEIAEQYLAPYRQVRVVGPGGKDLGPDASFDGLLSHRAVGRIPWEWISRVRPGGRLSLVVRTGVMLDGVLLRLTVARDGQSATGHFYGAPWPRALWLRSQRPTDRTHPVDPREAPRVPASVSDPHDHLRAGAQLMAGLLHPDLQMSLVRSGHPLDGDVADRLRIHDGQASRALIFLGGTYNAYEWGPRDLVSVLAEPLGQWRALRGPGPERFGLTVTRTNHVLWYGSPKGPSWTLPALPTPDHETT